MMHLNAKTGVFICKCGDCIEPLIDLNGLKNSIKDHADYCDILTQPCLTPGMEQIISAISQHNLNRIIVAGCDGRIMLKKFEKALEPLDILKGQVDMVNLRSHVAAVSDASPEQKAKKSEKLIKAAMADMKALVPTELERAKLDGPVAIVGNGIGAFPAAQKLITAGVECVLSLETCDPKKIISSLKRSYPGERQHYDRVKQMVEDVLGNEKLTIMADSRLKKLIGVTGDYTMVIEDSQGNENFIKASMIIAALDAKLYPPGPEFGHDGQTVLIQPEMEAQIDQMGIPKGDVVFWISDYEYGTPDFAGLSTKSAWSMAKHIKEASASTQIIIFYNQMMTLPLSATERGLSRKLGISWVPYDKAVRPTVQDGYITFCHLKDHVEHEISWDFLVLSPRRAIRGQEQITARRLGFIHKETPFLTGHHAKVRPEMIGREETYIVGSARYPCDLQETLNQGRKAGNKNAEMVEKSNKLQLFIPRNVCVVDPTKCVGCGQCQELCDCGGIGVSEYPGGGLPRMVDPMVCTGGGTCAAACPYNALVLQNNSTDQREARVATLSKLLEPGEVVSLACVWGGLPAADHAYSKKLTYDPAIHILGVPCVGQIDPSVMARAFLDGAPGLILIGCDPEECHHSFGIDHAWNRVNLIKKLFSLCGFDRRRIALAHADLNKPEEFVKTANAFTALIKALGPIEKTQANQDKLKSIYHLCKDNNRIRTLLSAALRRPGEKTYRGDQKHALAFDKDFNQALEEEYDYPESALFEEDTSGKGVLYV
ncbi:MAG: hydrogenase iron-sulfur subunit [Desulfobacteraceae bacterium]|nr:hydrogenase iron-sulfur subunit [Desulfobacteraceae bacterium]